MEDHINKLLEDLATSFKLDVIKVKRAFEWTKNKLAAKTGKMEPELSIVSYHALRAEITKKQSDVGKEMSVVFLGKDRSNDKHKKLRDEILAEFWDNPESRKKVKAEGKIIVLKVSNTGDFDKDHQPLISVKKSVEIDGEFIPTEGELWDPALNIDPLCRDYREFIDLKKEKKNWNKTQVLGENWNTTLFGVGSFKDTEEIIKKVQIRFFGDSGNPSAPTFVMRNVKLGVPYKIKGKLNEELTTEDCYVCDAKSKPVLDEEVGSELDIMKMFKGFDAEGKHFPGINEKWREYCKIRKLPEKDLVPIIDYDQLREWHHERRALKDEEEKIKKRKDGWDEVDYNEFCLIDKVSYLGRRVFKEDYTPAMLQHDSTGMSVHYANYDPDLDWEVPVPCDMLICVKTGRGTTRYDRESKTKIPDEENPDLSVNITGFKILIAYEKIMYPKEIIGDLS